MNVLKRFGGCFFCGTVVRLSSLKTVTIKFERPTYHKKFKKIITKHTILHTHNDNFNCSIGDKVLVKECSPVSKTKNFILVDILFKK